jgi:hypothetical protein
MAEHKPFRFAYGRIRDVTQPIAKTLLKVADQAAQAHDLDCCSCVEDLGEVPGAQCESRPACGPCMARSALRELARMRRARVLAACRRVRDERRARRAAA